MSVLSHRPTRANASPRLSPTCACLCRPQRWRGPTASSAKNGRIRQRHRLRLEPQFSAAPAASWCRYTTTPPPHKCITKYVPHFLAGHHLSLGRHRSPAGGPLWPYHAPLGCGPAGTDARPRAEHIPNTNTWTEARPGRADRGAARQIAPRLCATPFCLGGTCAMFVNSKHILCTN